MRDERGLVRIDGTAVADGRKMFVLRYLQARDPDLAGTPFFAAFSAYAAWLTDLGPAPGTRFPAAPVLLRRDDRPADRLHHWHCCQYRIAARKVAPAGSHVSSMAPVIMSPAGPRPPAELMATGLYCAWQDRPAAT